MKVFQTNFLRLAVLLIPTMLRRPAMVAMMRSLMKPVMLLQNRLGEQRRENLYNLMHTGQVCHIKTVLNDYYVGYDYYTGFEIEDANAEGEWLMIYDEGGERDVIIDSEQDHFFIDDEATASTDLEATGDEPGDINKVTLIGSREASALLWSEKSMLVHTFSFVVFVPDELYNDSELPVIRRLVNKYRLVSRLPRKEDYRLKSQKVNRIFNH